MKITLLKLLPRLPGVNELRIYSYATHDVENAEI